MKNKKNDIEIRIKKTEVLTLQHFKEEVNYAIYDSSLFKELFIASSSEGICFLAPHCTLDQGKEELKKQYPNAILTFKRTTATEEMAHLLNDTTLPKKFYKLHLIGTPFQQKVWEALISIPRGKTKTYQEITQEIKYGKAFRAVGSAIGKNPISLLIPCHRVVRTNGELGGYRWGLAVKETLLSYENRLNKKNFHYLLVN